MRPEINIGGASMKKLKRVLLVIVSLIVVEFVLIGCVVSGLIVPGGNASSQSQTAGAVQDSNVKDSSEKQKESFEVIKETEIVSSVLSIKLSGAYLNVYNEATKNLTDSVADKNKKLVALVGLQILQSKVIKYENALHFYSLNYTNSGAVQSAKYYSLKDCIDRINAGQKIYTDCFGFVRLAHSIAAYSINPKNPESVAGLSGLYGYKGSYTGASISSLSKLDCSTVIYDRLTGSGSSKNRHVAMFLYSYGNSAVYMDQGGVYTGTFKNDSYIYYSKSNPYKFNTFKNYC